MMANKCFVCGTPYQSPQDKFCSKCGNPHSGTAQPAGPTLDSPIVAPSATVVPAIAPLPPPGYPSSPSVPSNQPLTVSAYGGPPSNAPPMGIPVVPGTNYGYPVASPTFAGAPVPANVYAPTATPVNPSVPPVGAYLQPQPFLVASAPTNATDGRGFSLPVTGRWKADTCDCFQHCLPNCLLSCICPCITYSQINARLGLKPYKWSLLLAFGLWFGNIIGGALSSVSDTDCSLQYNYYYGSYFERCTTTYRHPIAYIGNALALTCSITWLIFLITQRKAVRTALSIPGDSCNDCCCMCCCECCSLAQMATQVGSYKPGNCDFGAPPRVEMIRNVPGHV